MYTKRHAHPKAQTFFFFWRFFHSPSWALLSSLLTSWSSACLKRRQENKASERNSVSWLKRWTWLSFWCGLHKQPAKLQEDDASHNVRPVSGERLLSGDKNAHVHLFIIKRALLYLYPIRVTPPRTHAHARSWGLWPVVHHMAPRQTRSGVMTSEQATVSSHVTDSPHVLPSQEHHGKTTNSCGACSLQRLQKL